MKKGKDFPTPGYTVAIVRASGLSLKSLSRIGQRRFEQSDVTGSYVCSRARPHRLTIPSLWSDASADGTETLLQGIELTGSVASVASLSPVRAVERLLWESEQQELINFIFIVFFFSFKYTVFSCCCRIKPPDQRNWEKFSFSHNLIPSWSTVMADQRILLLLFGL